MLLPRHESIMLKTNIPFSCFQRINPSSLFHPLGYEHRKLGTTLWEILP